MVELRALLLMGTKQDRYAPGERPKLNDNDNFVMDQRLAA